MARLFNGSSDYLQAANVDLSAVNKISIAFWIYWDTNSNDDKFAMEFTAANGSNTGGFNINPNYSGTSGKLAVAMKGDVGNNVDYVTQFTAAAWHHFAVQLDKSGSGLGAEIGLIWFDGVSQGKTVVASFDNTNNFANSTLNFMSRNGASNFGAGRLAEVAIWPGVLITQDEVTALLRGVSPLQIRPTAHPYYWPLIGRTSPEVELFYGATAAVTGASATPHPKTIYAASPLITKATSSGIVPSTASLVLTTFAPVIITPIIPFAGNLVLRTFAPTVTIGAPGPVITGSLLQIDWNDDGDFSDTGEDVTGRLISTQDLTTVRGKDQLRLLAPPMAGAFNCELDNRSRDYSVENAGSPIFTALHPGHKLRVTLTATSVQYPLFTGILDDLPQHPEFGRWTIEAPALGSLSRLRGKRISTELLEAVTTDEAMEAVLDAAGWPMIERTLQVGLTTLDWFWADNEDAFDVIATLLLTEGPGASVYESPTGYFIFENRHSRLTQVASTTSQFTFTDQDYIIGSQYDSGIQDIINEVEVGVTTRSVKDEDVVWQYGKPLILGASETRVLRAVSSDPFKNAQTPDPDSGINAIQRLSIIGTSPQIRLSFRDAQTGDIGPGSITPTAIQTALEGLGTIGSGNVTVAYASIAPDLVKFDITFQGDFAHQPVELLGVAGVGTTGKPLEVKIVDQIVGLVDDYDLLAGSVTSLTLSATSGASIEITIVAGGAGAYIDKLQMRAQAVTTDSTKRLLNTVDANDSIAKYGLHPYSPSTRQEITEEQAIQLADNIIRYYKDPRPMVVFNVAGTDGTIQLQQLTREISDRITIVDGQTGVNADFFIERIAHRIAEGPHIFTEFGCERVGEGTIGGGGDDTAIVGSATVGTSTVGA